MKISNEGFYKLQTLVPLFRGFSGEELVQILKMANSKVCKQGELIFKEKDSGESLFIVVKGGVKISKRISSEYDEVLAVLKAGNYFGEMAIIDNMPRSASAEATEDETMLLEISRTILSHKVHMAFKVYKNFCNVLSQRLREMNERVIKMNSEKIDLETRLRTFIKSKFQTDAKLGGSNFKGVDLKGAFFDRVDMRNSVAVNANFTEARFKNTSLIQATFSGTDIGACVFDSCLFNEADFSNATFIKTVFKNCKLNDQSLNKIINK